MAQHKMVVVNGVRYRSEDVPEGPRHAAELAPESSETAEKAPVAKATGAKAKAE